VDGLKAAGLTEQPSLQAGDGGSKHLADPAGFRLLDHRIIKRSLSHEDLGLTAALVTKP